MSTFNPDAGIPLLTEIIDIPVLSEPAPVSADNPPLAPLAATPAATAATPHWGHLEQELQERVLQQVLRRIDATLEQRVRDSLADVLQIAVDHLANDIRSGLQQTVSEVVRQAVALEIDAARNSQK